ncbi:arabinofuranosyltransferase [Micromonospora inaquosa]|uniref:arabinofuranosyltransferase n=1 Tax=Micromonospora inaquosa TaxID=2203716 RepID=UPI0013154058|nr:arabinofuranosyltransferase [Micromonospora inaquosa]
MTIADRRVGTTFERNHKALRPYYFALLGAIFVAFIDSVLPDEPYSSPLLSYGVRCAVLTIVISAVAATWWCIDHGRDWDTDLVPVLVAVVTAGTLLTFLHGTPFSLEGINGDQSFRTATLTRFADTAGLADFTYRDLPAYYSPALMWLLGRAADLFGLEPWRLLKYGTLAIAYIAPIVTYLLWRRLVAPRIAALISATTLITAAAAASGTIAEPYAWIVFVAFVPWWIEAVQGIRRAEVKPLPIIVSGLVGAALFATYYYFFFLGPLVFLIALGIERARGEFSWQKAGRGLLVLLIAAAGSAFFWLPLAVNFLSAENYFSYNNRYFRPSFGDIALPMVEPNFVGALAMTGLLYMIWSASRNTICRHLLAFFVAVYAWHVVGFVAALGGFPLMSFKMKELILAVCLVAAVMALRHLAEVTIEWTRRFEARRLIAAMAALLAVITADHFVTYVVKHPGVASAHNQRLPDGRLPRYADEPTKPASTATAQALSSAIMSNYQGTDRPVVLSDRIDLFAFYPYYGFVQWNAFYSHPTANFRGRVELVESFARVATPSDFTALLDGNAFDRIDVLVLRVQGDKAVFTYKDMDFPNGSKEHDATFPTALISPQDFNLTKLDGYLVAVRK